jgi:anti-anti-sigma factor
VDAAYSIDVIRGPDRVRVVLRGEIDMAAAEDLHAAIERALAEPMFEVDLREATFIDSTVINALVIGRAAAERGNVTMSVRAGPRPVMRPLEVAGVDHLFQLYAAEST